MCVRWCYLYSPTTRPYTCRIPSFLPFARLPICITMMQQPKAGPGRRDESLPWCSAGRRGTVFTSNTQDSHEYRMGFSSLYRGRHPANLPGKKKKYSRGPRPTGRSPGSGYSPEAANGVKHNLSSTRGSYFGSFNPSKEEEAEKPSRPAYGRRGEENNDHEGTIGGTFMVHGSGGARPRRGSQKSYWGGTGSNDLLRSSLRTPGKGAAPLKTDMTFGGSKPVRGGGRY